MADNLRIFGLDYQNILGIKAIDENGNELTYTRGAIPIPGGTDETPVKFYDYDGTILYEYSAEDFLALSAMPATATHAGMTANGWNWSLADARAYVNAYGALNIGQQYVETQIDITLMGGALSPYLTLGINGTVSVDWGDGNTSTMTGTALSAQVRQKHDYAAAGDYTIQISIVSGSFTVTGSSYTTMLSNGQTSSGNMPQNRQYASSVRNIRLGSNITLLMNYAFQYCVGLKNITIPNNITSIGTNMCSSCYNLESASLPNSMLNIETSMFNGCYNLQSFTIPNSVETIGANVFYGCGRMQNIIIPSSVTSMSTNVFAYCYNLQKVTIPNSFSKVITSTFTYCYSLQDVTIPSTVEVIDISSFSNCYSLQSITLPNSTTNVAANAFYYCYSLQSITLPNSVTNIGGNAFQNCYGLQSVTCLATTPPTAGTTMFNGVPTTALKIYVPAASLSAYQSATNWSTYASCMEGI